MDTRTLCLGALAIGEASGYEIKKRFEDGPLAHFNRVAFGSIYPALRDLERDGLIETREETQDGRPDKRVHRLTTDGRLVLARSVSASPPPDQFRSDFLFMLFFSELLPEPQKEKLIAERCAFYRTKIEAMTACQSCEGIQDEGHRLVHGFGLAVYRAALDYLESLPRPLRAETLPPAAAE